MPARLTPDVAVPRKRAGFMAYASCIRYREVLILQGSPLFGMAFAVRDVTLEKILSMVVCTLASSLLVAHVFSLNDWAGIAPDSNDPNKSADVFITRGIGRHGVAALSLGLLAASLLLLALLPVPTLLLGFAIAALGALYSHPAFDAKGAPVASSLPHLVGGGLHFLLGYSVFSALDQRGLLIALFFALTFTAGHLNQEVRDYDGDRLNGIRTNAVVFGKMPAFIAGLVLFTVAYADLFVLAYRGIVPTPLVALPAVLYPIHVGWSITTLRGALSFANVSRFQDRYRILYAVIGVAMLAALAIR